jgi:hypothetical protein
MSRAQHKDDVERVEPAASEPAGKDAPPGKVVIDSRGHNVWQWAKDVIESTSVLLKRLEVKDLALEPTHKVPILGGKAAEKGADSKAAKPADPKAKPGKPADTKAGHPAMQRDRNGGRDGGFDPYNSR